MARSREKKGFKGFFYDWIIPIGVAAILALLVNKFIMFKVYIPSGSMIPTINIEDQIFVTKIYNHDKIKSGDILVFNSKELNDKLIKRVIGLPGDKIQITDGIVFRNGEKLEEDYIGTPDKFNGEFEVPEGHYFFLGDNRAQSKDSRYFLNSYIPAEDIMGKAQLRVYPFDNIGLVR